MNNNKLKCSACKGTNKMCIGCLDMIERRKKERQKKILQKKLKFSMFTLMVFMMEEVI